MIEDSELRAVVALGAMETVTRLITGQHPDDEMSMKEMGNLMMLLTESVRDALPAADQRLHPPADNDMG